MNERRREPCEQVLTSASSKCCTTLNSHLHRVQRVTILTVAFRVVPCRPLLGRINPSVWLARDGSPRKSYDIRGAIENDSTVSA